MSERAATLKDQGRLKPVYTTTLVGFSDRGCDGSRTFLAQTPIEMKPTKDGKLVGRTQISKDFLELAQIRILTLTVDGQRQTGGAASYYIPLKRFVNKNAGGSTDLSGSTPRVGIET